MNPSDTNEPLRGYVLLERAANEGCSLSFALFVDDSKKKNKNHNRTVMNLLSLLGESDYPIAVTDKNDIHAVIKIENDAVKYMYAQYLLLSQEEDNRSYEDDKR